MDSTAPPMIATRTVDDIADASSPLPAAEEPPSSVGRLVGSWRSGTGVVGGCDTGGRVVGGAVGGLVVGGLVVWELPGGPVVGGGVAGGIGGDGVASAHTHFKYRVISPSSSSG